MSATTPGVDFRATHRVPSAGLATYPAPDGAATRGPSLDPQLDVQVLEQRADGWACIACSNGWTAWGDARLLTPLPRFVPGDGLVTFGAPDPEQHAGVRLDPGLELSVAEHRHDGWAHVVCSNGWTAWVDGRLLVERAPAPPVVTMPVVTVPGAGASPAGAVARSADQLFTRWLPLAAGTLVLIGAFVPWFRSPGKDISPWRVTLWFLLTRPKSNPQPHIGVVVLLPAALLLAYALVPLVSRRAVSRWVLFVGALLALDLPLFYFGRWLHPDTGIGLDIGPVAVFAGGVIAWMAHWQTRPARVASGVRPT